MPLLGFTVFKEKILDGSKTQTIRRLRKYPIKKGDKLYLYWHTRRPDCTPLGTASCTEEFEMRIKKCYNGKGEEHLSLCVYREDSFPNTDIVMGCWHPIPEPERSALIKRDGFESAEEMLSFFNKHYDLPEVFQVIRWDNLAISNPKETSEGKK